jgi:TnpA family transposase
MATKESLIALLKRKNLTSIIDELNNGSTTFDDCLSRSKEDWEKYYGLPGVDIYNHLHPQTQRII